MTEEEAVLVLRAAGQLVPKILEAVAVVTENHKVDGGYGPSGFNDGGEVWMEDSAGSTLAALAARFRSMV